MGFVSSQRTLEECHSIELTDLYPVRAQVDDANRKRLMNLAGEVRIYTADDWLINNDAMLHKRLMSASLSVDVLELKVGAQVMLISNLDQEAGLVNGSIGIVTSFDEKDPFMPTVRFSNGLVRKMSKQEWTVEENRRVMARRLQVFVPVEQFSVLNQVQ